MGKVEKMTRTDELWELYIERGRELNLEVAELKLKNSRELEELMKRLLQTAVEDGRAFNCEECETLIWREWYRGDDFPQALREGNLCYSCYTYRATQKACEVSRDILVGAVVEDVWFGEVEKPDRIALLLKDGSRVKYDIEYSGDD
jgi:hypothetical protein